MTSVEFCYWLQGFFEVADPSRLTATQVDLIKRHLRMVFRHEIDPSYPADQQADLQRIHNDHNILPGRHPSGFDRDTMIKC